MDEYIKQSQSKIQKSLGFIKKHKIKSVIGLIVLVVVFVGVLRQGPEAQEAQAVLKRVDILHTDVLQSDGGEVPVVGTLKANEQLDLRPQIPGQVSVVRVELNQEVTAGQILVELKHADLDASVAQASASLQSALASLAKMKNGARPEDQIISEQNLEAAKQQLADMKNGGRPEEVAQAELAVQSAQLAVDDAYVNHLQTVQQNELNKTTSLENAVQGIQSAQFSEDQILELDLISVFNSNNDYKLIPIIKDKSLENESNSLRRNVEYKLDNWRSTTSSLSASNKDSVLAALEVAKSELNNFLYFIDVTGDALDEAHPSLSYDASAISSAITIVNTARLSIKSQVDIMISFRQAILNQGINNAKALESAQTQIDNSEAGLNNAQEQLQIVKQGPTPEQIAIQQTKVTQAEQQLLIAQNGARPEDLRLQQASVAQASASLALASANREKAIVRAPISGTITYLPVDISDMVSSSSIVVSIANKTGLEVETFVTEDERTFINIGNPVTIDEKYEGVIREIAPALNPINKKVEIKITVISENPILTLGESVRLLISKTSPERSVIKVPLSAVKLRAEGAEVLLLNSEDVLEVFEVEIGGVTANKIEIISTFPEGARLVKDARGLKPGQQVVVNGDTE